MALRLRLDPRSSVPLGAQISEGITLAVALGELSPGEQLPTVRQLSVDLRVNANTVGRVYSELERAGLLETQRGRGTFVRARIRVAPGARDRRLESLSRSFLRVCGEEGYALEEVVGALEAMRREAPVKVSGSSPATSGHAKKASKDG